MSSRSSLLIVLTFCFLVFIPKLGPKTVTEPNSTTQNPDCQCPRKTVSLTRTTSGWCRVPAAARRRLTSFQGQTANPNFSPDGRWIAFSGEYAGNFDVYIVSAEGGEPRRLTWHPGADLVEGWTPDGKSILFSSNRATWAPSGAPRFWTVSTEGGVETPMTLPRAYQGKISADGSHIAYRMNNSWDEERRNYRRRTEPVRSGSSIVKTYEPRFPPTGPTPKTSIPMWVERLSLLHLRSRRPCTRLGVYQTKRRKLVGRERGS